MAWRWVIALALVEMRWISEVRVRWGSLAGVGDEGDGEGELGSGDWGGVLDEVVEMARKGV